MTALHAPNPRKLATVILVLRATGAVFLLAALVFFTNMGGMADVIGLTDLGTRQILSIVLVFVGLYDIAIMPMILTRAAKKATLRAAKDTHA